jgi:hypothetical protein
MPAAGLLAHVLGLDDSSGRVYLWWSGVGSDLGEVAIVGALVAHVRRHTCHVDHPRFCWRPATHPVAGTPYRTCKKHHPAVPERVSADHIADAHAEGASPAADTRRTTP